MTLTRREKRFLIAALILSFIFLFTPQPVVNDWELLILFVVVGPLGFYIATDPERRKVEK